MLGMSSVANALSQYIDSLTGKKIQAALINILPFNSPMLGPYPDFLALGLVLVVTGLLKFDFLIKLIEFLKIIYEI